MAAIDGVARETTLFAAIWFLIGGIDDLLVDLIFVARSLRPRSRRRASIDRIPLSGPMPPGRIVLFVPAWDESAVIGNMLRTALDRFEHPDYRIYVGTYPNDRATIDAVARVAEQDPRISLVIGAAPGPTTKADCLNTLWRALLRDEAADGECVRAVVLHDAEDVVHRYELRVFAHLLVEHDAVQLPVLPLPHPQSRLVAGHYLDEFAEAHGKQLLVRQALGAGMPLAGVGCAIRRETLGRIAEVRGGAPFDAESLTEDYELGLTIGAAGGSAVLARVPDKPGGRTIAVRAYFPHRLDAAVRQKARWLTGIALAGWDRTGWSRAGNLGDHWMRMRDRRATLAIPVLATAYCALVVWGMSLAGHLLARSAPVALDPLVQHLLLVNVALLTWRLLVRAAFVWRACGWQQAALSAPRMIVGNYIALLAARRAAGLYARLLAGGAPRWDKTDHDFPEHPERVAV